MSMLGNFRQVSPQLLMRIKACPALVGEVIDYRPSSNTPTTDVDGLISLMPAHMRKGIEEMPEEDRAKFLAALSDSLTSEQIPLEFRQQIQAMVQSSRSRKSKLDPNDLGEELDIAKDWHAIHFLLCGVAGDAPGPLGDTILGGTEIGNDRGYGPARYLEVAQTKAIAEALEMIGPAKIGNRYSAAEMNRQQIYPNGWSDDPDTKAYLCKVYSGLRAFYINAARKCFGVLLYLS